MLSIRVHISGYMYRIPVVKRLGSKAPQAFLVQNCMEKSSVALLLELCATSNKFVAQSSDVLYVSLCTDIPMHTNVSTRYRVLHNLLPAVVGHGLWSEFSCAGASAQSVGQASSSSSSQEEAYETSGFAVRSSRRNRC